MERVYRITLIFLILILLLSNVAFFAVGEEFLAYLKVETKLESPQDIISQAKSSMVEDQPFFDLSIFESEKFNKLKYFEIDLDSIVLPGDLSPGDQIEIGDDGEIIIGDKDSNFEIGNPNPFAPIF
jgi:hypothetical protein